MRPEGWEWKPRTRRGFRTRQPLDWLLECMAKCPRIKNRDGLSGVWRPEVRLRCQQVWLLLRDNWFTPLLTPSGFRSSTGVGGGWEGGFSGFRGTTWALLPPHVVFPLPMPLPQCPRRTSVMEDEGPCCSTNSE